MNDLASFISTVLGIAVTLVAGLRWLLNIYYQKELQLNAAKHELVMKQIGGLDDTVSKLEKVVSDHSYRMNELKQSLDKSFFRYDAKTDSLKAVTEELKEYSKETKTELRAYQKELADLTSKINLQVLKGRGA